MWYKPVNLSNETKKLFKDVKPGSIVIKDLEKIIMNVNYFKSALLHHSKGNWNKAKEIYEHILKSDPDNYLVLQNYGPILSQLKEYKLAKNIFEKCLKINPKDSLLLYNYLFFL